MSNQKPLPLKAGETPSHLWRWSGCLWLISLPLFFWRWSPVGTVVSILYVILALIGASVTANECHSGAYFCGLLFGMITFPAIPLVNKLVPKSDLLTIFRHQPPTSSDLVVIGLYTGFCTVMIYIIISLIRTTFELLRKKRCPNCGKFQSRRVSKINPAGFYVLAIPTFIEGYLGGHLLSLAVSILAVIGVSVFHIKSKYSCQVCGYHFTVGDQKPLPGHA